MKACLTNVIYRFPGFMENAFHCPREKGLRSSKVVEKSVVTEAYSLLRKDMQSISMMLRTNVLMKKVL